MNLLIYILRSCNRFLVKGYDKRILDDCLPKVKDIDRRSLLKPRTVTPKMSWLVCVTTFSDISMDIWKAIKKHWYILESDPLVGHLFKEFPLFAQKRAPNLSDTLVKTDSVVETQKTFWTLLPNGNFPCHRCVQCHAMIKGDSFTHPHSGHKYPVNSKISCHTKFVVYLLKCPCGLCYVGKTKRELKTRISEHKSSIRNHDEKSLVARHFDAFGNEVCTLRFQGVEEDKPLKRGGNREKFLLQRKVFWIQTLQTEHPQGLNEELVLSCFCKICK